MKSALMSAAATAALMSTAALAGDLTPREQQVVDLLKSLETGATEPVAIVNPDKYNQHNLMVADGLEGLGAVLAQLPPGQTRVDTIRVFEDGDYVVAHTDYNFFGPKIGFDIFRFEDGKIVEHWDNLQETAGPNPSGHSMIDGPTEITDLDKTAENKALVKGFVTDILVGGKFDLLPTYIDGDAYTQHNPQIADGLSGLSAALEAMAKAGVTMEYKTLHGVFGKGNFVLTVSEGSFAGKHTSFYDLFRVESGRIVEHWDVIEEILPADKHANQNGKFGFR
ncbi:MAG: nuclear transport factor 2 family protein [Tabrizicola sp.]|nr:nuclear transport factor 2 family protein [Tabrizicola sp.]